MSSAKRDQSAITSFRWALDPAAWAMESGACGDIKIQPWQRRVLHSDALQIALLCSRQAGKSTITAVKALHTSLFWPGSLSLIIAPTEDQSKELLRKAATSLRGLHEPPRLLGDSTELLEFHGGSRLVALPGSNPKTIRGYSNPKLIVIDEAAYLSDETYFALRPMLAQGRTQLMALSSAGPRQGWFFEAYEYGQDWERYLIDCYQCPHLSQKFLDAERAKDERIFRREFLCEWSEFSDQVFALRDIDEAITDDVPVLDIAVGL